jgi:putative phosphoesterase
MRIAVISDIHSNLEAFKAVLNDMPRVDMILCAGDLVGYGAEPNEVVRLASSRKVRSVMGNHDYASISGDTTWFNPVAAQAVEWTRSRMNPEAKRLISSLPTRLELKLSGWRVYVVHGSPRDPLNEYLFPDVPNRELADATRGADADVVILGHTHVPMRRMILGKLVINPGGVGQPRDRDPRASYVIMKLGSEIEVENRRVEYDFRATAEKIKKAGLPEELGTRLFFGW